MKKLLLLRLLLATILLLIGCHDGHEVIESPSNLLLRYEAHVKPGSSYVISPEKVDEDSLFALLEAISEETFDQLNATHLDTNSNNSHLDTMTLVAEDVTCQVVHSFSINESSIESKWYYTLGSITWTYMSHPDKEVMYVAIQTPPDTDVKATLAMTEEQLYSFWTSLSLSLIKVM